MVLTPLIIPGDDFTTNYDYVNRLVKIEHLGNVEVATFDGTKIAIRKIYL